LVRLRWQPATESREDSELLGYNLYRREGIEPFPFSPVNREILVEPDFEDFDLENGRTYTYAVRTVVRIMGKTVESALSSTVSATPQPGL
jgi:hypothetical protein